MKKVLAIGPKISEQKKYFSGQAMMFEGFVQYLINERKWYVKIVNIAPSSKNRTTGKWSVYRSLEYIIILIRIFICLLMRRYDFVYLTGAQSKVGFFRDYCVVWLASLFRVKVVNHQFGANYLGFYNSLSPFYRRKLIRMLEKTDKIIVEGECMKGQFQFFPGYEQKVNIVSNGMPGKVIQTGYRHKFFPEKGPFRMIYLSNMIYSKGYMDVLKAVDLLVNRDKKDVFCVFAGKFITVADNAITESSESVQDVFFQYIRNHGLEKNVVYYEGLFGKEKKENFLQSHVFLLPTYFVYEGQPVSVLEAMAYGNVPVVTRYRHIPDMVNEESGLFVEAKSPDDIAQQILFLMAHPDKFEHMSALNICLYQEHFTFNKYCDRMIACVS